MHYFWPQHILMEVCIVNKNVTKLLALLKVFQFTSYEPHGELTFKCKDLWKQ